MVSITKFYKKVIMQNQVVVELLLEQMQISIDLVILVGHILMMVAAAIFPVVHIPMMIDVGKLFDRVQCRGYSPVMQN